MDNLEKLKKVFFRALNLSENTVVESLEYESVKNWDSVAHMKLISDLETKFEVMIDTMDVIDMSSFKKAQEILSKYGIVF